MPGASSVASATFIFNRAPQDGTVLGSFSRNVPTQTVMGQSGIQFDLRRFIWIGGTSQPSVRVCAKWHSNRVQTADDLFQNELIVPGGGPSSAPSIIPTVLNNVIGTRFRLVEGYRGTSLAMMAMERGEVEGVCQSLSQFRMVASHVQSGEVRFLLHVDENPVPELPDVASAFRYAKTEEQKQLLRFIFISEKFVRSYVLPPNVPADRVETLRRAIAETAKDPDLLAEAKKMDVDMSYQPPEGFVVLLQRLYGASPELIDRVKKLVPNPG
jgi:tripartite-type tricarboxylate transporter receptor subunit TctC